MPLHVLDNPESIAYVLQDSGAELVVAATGTQWLAIASAGTAFTALRHVLLVSGQSAVSATGTTDVKSVAEWRLAAAWLLPARWRCWRKTCRLCARLY